MPINATHTIGSLQLYSRLKEQMILFENVVEMFVWKYSVQVLIIALCGYPHVKVSIRDLCQISATSPIFQQYNYFRQNLEENVTFTFYFFSFGSNFPCKIL